MLDVHKPVGCSLHQAAKAAFTLQRRTLAQVFAVEHHPVESIILERRGLLAEAPAQLLEVGLAVLAWGHGLAVKDGVLDRKVGQRLADDSELGRPVDALAGIDDGPWTVDVDLRAVAVPLIS
jgi:hypothetical protein